MGAASEGLKYFSNFNIKKDKLIQKQKTSIRPLYFQTLYFSHLLYVLNDLKSYGCAISSFAKQKTSLKCNDDETMPKNLKVESKIWSYVPKLNIDPFISKGHILFIP